MADAVKFQIGGEPRKIAWALALAGLAPFALLALSLLFTDGASAWRAVLADGFKTWSAVILSFLGGIRWGMALRSDPVETRMLALSIVPAFVGWLAIFLPDAWAISVLLVAYCAQGAWDSFAVQARKAPHWFGGLRMTLTALVAVAHALALIAVV